jgi:Outer membrane protein beta-barrel domain
MHQATRTSTRTHTSAVIIASIALLGPLGGNAFADDSLGIYVGGSVGQSHLRADQLNFIGPYPPNPSLAPVSISKSATGWKVFAGFRPISLLGAELAYTDFGHPMASQGPPALFGLSYDASLRSKAATAFGIVYAPIPIPILDLYAKAGVARLQTSVDATGVFGCWPPLQCAAYPVAVHRDQTDARFAYGAGIQAKLSAIGIRLEYERISVSGGDTDLLSLGMTWTF